VTRNPGLPDPHPAPGLPARVMIWEVGARDGLQNESVVLAAQVKAEFLDRLAAAGLRVLEATSFGHPRWVPQLADATELLGLLTPRRGVRYPVLVPNERGLDRALAAGVTEIAIFASATASFARRNLNRDLEEQFAMFAPVLRRATASALRVRGYLSMCFGDPWEGAVPIEQVVGIGRRLLDLGCDQLCLGDTIGVATPGHVVAVLEGFGQAGVGIDALAVHFHDTYGQALSNTLAALRAGVSCVDASAGGLGGCPYAGSATGNLATEDLVWMLEGLGIEHGVNLEALVQTSVWMAGQLGRPSPSRVVRALSS
jgi:hydroxymethylglutaryl-CoA lyase